MADGSITFSTALDNKELEGQLADLRHEIEGAEKDLGSSKDLGLTKSIEAAKEAAGALAKELALIPSEFAPGYDKDTMQFVEEYAEGLGYTAPVPIPPGPTPEDIILDTLADHEYRLCLTELGAN